MTALPLAIEIFPSRAGSFSGQVDMLYLFLVGISLLIVLGLLIVIAIFLVKYRRGAHANRRVSGMSTLKIELTWTILPFLIFLVLFFWGAKLYLDEGKPPANAKEIFVVGRQWMWDIRHLNGRREHNRLHIPINTPIRLTMVSEDVIHSFYVPAFRIKHDLLPGRYVTEWFTAKKAGVYPLYCAEYCGTKHSAMTGEIIVMKPQDYARWLNEQPSEPSLAQRGELLYHKFSCSGCHEPGGTVRAPSLHGLYGNPVPLSDGQTVTADSRYIRDSILFPLKDVVGGYAPVMPSFNGQIKEGDLLALIEYIKSISHQESP